ncbi:MAG: hypothetical protein KUG65_05985 [Sphingomonadaceae bacterium]|nr:hypothetical protein [Sphingomonadaceae bacterium]
MGRSGPIRKHGLGVTDHALVRWLERSGAMDVEQMREWLASSLDRAAGAAGVLHVTRFNILADGLVYVVRDGAVVTVLTDGQLRAHSLAPDRD